MVLVLITLSWSASRVVASYNNNNYGNPAHHTHPYGEQSLDNVGCTVSGGGGGDDQSCVVKNLKSLVDRVKGDEAKDDALSTRRHALEIAQAGIEGVLTRTVFQRTMSIVSGDGSENSQLVIKPLKEGHIIHGGRSSLDKEKVGLDTTSLTYA